MTVMNSFVRSKMFIFKDNIFALGSYNCDSNELSESQLQNPQWHFQRNPDILIAACTQALLVFFFCSVEAIRLVRGHIMCYFY